MNPLIFTRDLPAPVDEVFRLWTTPMGIATFFAPDCRVDAVPDGPYEIYFDPDAPPGERGAEGMRVLSVDPPRFFSFTWNGPPSIPTIRAQRLWVEIRLEPLEAGRCRLTLINGGYGDGPDWAETQQYFRRAWGEIVLPRLEKSLIDGPTDWKER